MIKAIILNSDDMLYNFKTVQRAGVGAQAAYAKKQFRLPEEQTRRKMEALTTEWVEKMGPIVASHNHMLYAELWLTKWSFPIFPHAVVLVECYWQALLGAMVPQEGAVEILRGLQMRGFLISIGMDTTAYVQYKRIEKLGFDDVIDFVVTSGECGMDEPLRHFFKYNAGKANGTLVRAGRAKRIGTNKILFVGDSVRHDPESAHTVGTQALLFDPGNACPEEKERMQRFSELPEVLKRLLAEIWGVDRVRRRQPKGYFFVLRSVSAAGGHVLRALSMDYSSLQAFIAMERFCKRSVSRGTAQSTHELLAGDGLLLIGELCELA